MKNTLLNTISNISDVVLSSTFKVGIDNYSRKNKNQMLTTSQLKAAMISEKERVFITRGSIKGMQETFQKNSFEKIRIKTLKKTAVYAGKTVLTNSLN